MIRTESEYRRTLARLEQNKKQLEAQHQFFLQDGLTPAEANRALMPLLSFQAQLEEELELYNRLRRGELPKLHSLSDIGQWLIGVRIAQGLSQKELALKLGVSEQQVSRDERNEYHSITTDRAQAILDVMRVEYVLEETTFKNTPDQIEALLKADKSLNLENASRLSRLFRAAYLEAQN
jgi:transcriptional regulator with XRE-family HTH domain